MRSALARLGLKHKNKEEKEKQISFDSWHSRGKAEGFAPQLNGARYFSFEELLMYTDNFSENNHIGSGSSGNVYIGHLPNGELVAIKWEGASSERVEKFKNVIELLSRVHHKNIVSFLGFCFEQESLMLVYEYICMGSLHNYLTGTTSTYLDWKQRLEIALDLARGLAYLHELENPQIIHGDVTPSHILLDENMNAKITSFGLSKLNRDKTEVYADYIEGAPGYIDPNYAITGLHSEKCDVYSVGLIMLQLITAKSVLNNRDEEDKHTTLKEMVMKAIDQYDQEYFGLRDIIDPKIISQVRNIISLRKFAQLALACLQELPLCRPFMYEIMKEIDIILQNYGSRQSIGTWHSGDKGDAAIIPQLNCARYFTFEELQMSTDNFSNIFRIASRSIGPIYIGYLPKGEVVAITRSDEKIFGDADEIELFSRIDHKNIVSLVGFCFDQGEQMLVHEYISKGTLRDNLNEKFDIHLSWKRRLQIALDSARGLTYLHEDADPQIIHTDIKSTNIMLDDNLNAKIINFSVSKLIPGKKEYYFCQEVVGSPGYLDPEYMRTFELSEKMDVYSLGVVMLELITAQNPIIREEDDNVTHLRVKVMTAIDQCDQEYFGLKELIDPKILSQARYISLRMFVQLALVCLEESSSSRPSMFEVAKEIEIILQNYEDGTRTASARYYEDDGNASDLPKLQRCLTI